MNELRITVEEARCMRAGILEAITEGFYSDPREQQIGDEFIQKALGARPGSILIFPNLRILVDAEPDPSPFTSTSEAWTVLWRGLGFAFTLVPLTEVRERLNASIETLQKLTQKLGILRPFD